MGSIANAFGPYGSMSHANVHVGKLQVYNDLNVEDKLTCESDAEVQGTLTVKNLKMGESTTISESDFTNLKKGVNGVIDDASVAPAEKKAKLDPEKDGNGNLAGLKETVNMTDQTDYLQAKG